MPGRTASTPLARLASPITWPSSSARRCPPAWRNASRRPPVAPMAHRWNAPPDPKGDPMRTQVLERSAVLAAGAAEQSVDNATFVTLTVADQLCGIPVLGVRDILGEQAITCIPLAAREIAGSLNLRGRIVTA